MRLICTTIAAVLLASTTYAQPMPPKPGSEHAMLKKHEGEWIAVMSAGGTEFKGTATYKMELGGLWLVGTIDIDMGGQKFTGRSLETYDAASKKFNTVWVDSMGTRPMLMEGTYDATTKALTSTGDAPGPDGKPAKWKSITALTNDDSMEMKMFVGDTKEPMFTVTYKRKK